MYAQRRLRSAWASAQSDQSPLCTQCVAKDSMLLHPNSKVSDQTRRTPRLILVFAGRACHFVGFVVLRLIWLLCLNSVALSIAAHEHSIKPSLVNAYARAFIISKESLSYMFLEINIEPPFNYVIYLSAGTGQCGWCLQPTNRNIQNGGPGVVSIFSVHPLPN